LYYFCLWFVQQSLYSLQTKWFETQTCPDSTIEDATATTIESLAGLFVTFAVISILALLLFAWKKRSTIKHYLCILACRKRWSSQKKDPVIDNFDTISNRSQNYQLHPISEGRF
jgi:hypothetical protein